MDSMVELYLDRAENELLAARALQRLSEDAKLKTDAEIPAATTFYSGTISHAYYAIFYAAKALLLTEGVKTSSPDIHKRTYEAFERTFVTTGVLDVKLLQTYQTLAIRAEELLGIFKMEKWKRGNFTYTTIPQANKEPATDSVKRATLFVAHLGKVAKTKR